MEKKIMAIGISTAACLAAIVATSAHIGRNHGRREAVHVMQTLLMGKFPETYEALNQMIIENRKK